MPQYKVTFIFNQNRQGWSETLYYNGSNLPAVKDAANNLAHWRRQLLGTGSHLEAWRISDIAKPRQCGLVDGGDPSITDLNTDAPWTGILTEICAGNAEYRRSMIIRGIPDDWVFWDAIQGRLVVGATYKKKAEAWCTALKSGWQLRVISKDEVDVNEKPAGNVIEAAGNKTSFPMAGSTAVEGQTMRLSGFTGADAKLLNGVHKVLSNSAGVVTLDIPFDQITDPQAAKGGKAHHQKIVYRAITECKPLRPAKKSTGRAFFVPRGRRSENR